MSQNRVVDRVNHTNIYAKRFFNLSVLYLDKFAASFDVLQGQYRVFDFVVNVILYSSGFFKRAVEIL